ncbi:MAG: Gfo/Idh/MocA family oxidoreductase [Rhodopseudomonas palustris]|nr:Gfo/Idh/MocA family oxidoreductase [Rhodopseudomonas palustris]
MAYYRRALPRFLKVKEILEAGRIGQPRAVTVALYRPHSPVLPGVSDWRVNPTVAGGGLFVDMGCHTLDFLDYVLGPIRTAHGLAANRETLYSAEDTVAAAFEFESGVQGTGLWWFRQSDRPGSDGDSGDARPRRLCDLRERARGTRGRR